jgi:hypothetical protein
MFGATTVMSGLPCICIFTPVVTFVHTTIAIAVHHRIPAGVAILAFLLAIVFGLLVTGIFWLVLGQLVILYGLFQVWLHTPEAPQALLQGI